MDGIYEYTNKPVNIEKRLKYSKILKIVRIFVWILTFITFFFAFNIANIFWILFVFLILDGIGLIYLGRKITACYDYCFVEGDVTISKVMNESKRKFLIKFQAKNISQIGSLDGKLYNSCVKNKEFTKIIAISGEPKETDYCMIVNENENKYFIIASYDETFMNNILRFSGIRVLDQDYKDILKNK